MIDPALRTVVLGSGLLGVVSGALGCFAVLRRQSLLGDALAHATLPGVCIAFLVALSLGIDPKHPLVLLSGAMTTAWIGTLLVMALTRATRLKSDAAIGIVLSVFFGIGIALLTATRAAAPARPRRASTSSCSARRPGSSRETSMSCWSSGASSS